MTFILGLTIGITVGFMARHLWRRSPTKQTVAAVAAQPTQTYGHPWSPVKELSKALPDPPSGFAWEIKVDVNERGEHVMTLTMVDVAAGKNVAASSVNLTQYRPHGTTWREFYRRFRLIARGDFDSEIVGPLADWAVGQVNRRRAGETTEYRMEAS